MEKVQEKLKKIAPILNEKQRRIVYVAEAEQIGRGGKSQISAITGMARSTLNAGFSDLKALENKNLGVDNERIRRVGGGRKQISKTNPDLVKELESLIDPLTRGDPMSPL
jgi:hypothetical protein